MNLEHFRTLGSGPRRILAGPFHEEPLPVRQRWRISLVAFFAFADLMAPPWGLSTSRGQNANAKLGLNMQVQLTTAREPKQLNQWTIKNATKRSLKIWESIYKFEACNPNVASSWFIFYARWDLLFPRVYGLARGDQIAFCHFVKPAKKGGRRHLQHVAKRSLKTKTHRNGKMLSIYSLIRNFW